MRWPEAYGLYAVHSGPKRPAFHFSGFANLQTRVCCLSPDSPHWRRSSATTPEPSELTWGSWPPVLRSHAAVTARAGLPMERPLMGPSLPAPAPTKEVTEKSRWLSTFWWAMLVARVYQVFPLVCSRCGEPMRIIAFADVGTMHRILAHLGEPTQPPRIAPAARGPPPSRRTLNHAKALTPERTRSVGATGRRRPIQRGRCFTPYPTMSSISG